MEYKVSTPRYVVCSYKVDLPKITFDEFKALEKSSIISIDTETTGLDYFANHIIMIQLKFYGKFSIAFDAREMTPEQFQYLGKLLNEAQLLIAANMTFDYNMLKGKKVVLTSRTFDVLDAAKLLELGKYDKIKLGMYKVRRGYTKYSLAGVSKDVIDYEMDKSVRKIFTFIGSKPFSDKEFLYGLIDAEVLEDIYIELRKRAIKAGYTKKYQVGKLWYDDLLFSSAHSICLADMEYNGVLLDKEQWLSNKPYFIQKASEAEALLTAEVLEVKAEVTLGLFGAKVDINWMSSKQTLRFFLDNFNMALTDSKGKSSAGKEALEKVDLPIARLILDYRKAYKAITAFGEEFIKKYVRPDGRVHSRYVRMVDTFRLASYQPNVQQIPGLDSFRKSFIAPKGHKLQTADYPQQEIRIGGDRANCNVTREFYANGHGDAHSFNASKILTVQRGVPVNIPPNGDEGTPERALFNAHPDNKARKPAKVLSFLIPYGGGPKGLAEKVKIPLKEAAALIADYYKVYPKKLQYNQRIERFALSQGYVYLNKISSIRRYFPESVQYKKLKAMSRRTPKQNAKLRQLEGAIKRKGPNTTIQGTAAMMTKAASILEREMLLEAGVLPTLEAIVKAVLVVHDEKSEELKIPEANHLKHILIDSMNEAARIFCATIPMFVVAELEDSWKH